MPHAARDWTSQPLQCWRPPRAAHTSGGPRTVLKESAPPHTAQTPWSAPEKPSCCRTPFPTGTMAPKQPCMLLKPLKNTLHTASAARSCLRPPSKQLLAFQDPTSHPRVVTAPHHIHLCRQHLGSTRQELCHGMDCTSLGLLAQAVLQGGRVVFCSVFL